MKPYIHYIYKIKNSKPGELINTIKGKNNFNKFILDHYIEQKGSPICFRLDSWKKDIYYKAFLFPYLKGKNKGMPRPMFVEMVDSESDQIDIPF